MIKAIKKYVKLLFTPRICKQIRYPTRKFKYLEDFHITKFYELSENQKDEFKALLLEIWSARHEKYTPFDIDLHIGYCYFFKRVGFYSNTKKLLVFDEIINNLKLTFVILNGKRIDHVLPSFIDPYKILEWEMNWEELNKCGIHLGRMQSMIWG